MSTTKKTCSHGVCYFVGEPEEMALHVQAAHPDAATAPDAPAPDDDAPPPPPVD